MVWQVQVLVTTKHDHSNSFPGSHMWEQRTNISKMASDPYVHA